MGGDEGESWRGARGVVMLVLVAFAGAGEPPTWISSVAHACQPFSSFFISVSLSYGEGAFLTFAPGNH
jgi:hypothetical protein